MAVVSVAERGRFEGWPAHVPTELVIAERMLAVALHNYHVACTGRGSMAAMKTWDQLTDTQKAFLIDHAIPAAMQSIWKGRS